MTKIIRTEIEVLSGDPVPELHGHIVISSKNTVGDSSKHLKLGWTIKEEIGIAVVNPRALAKLKMYKKDNS